MILIKRIVFNKPMGTVQRKRTRFILLGMTAVCAMIFAFLRFQVKYQPTQEAFDAMQSDSMITVTSTADYDRYQPAASQAHGIVIYPDERIHPAAYAVLARTMAQELQSEVFVRHYPFGSTLLGLTNQKKLFQINEGIQTWDVVLHGNGAFQSSFMKQLPVRSLIFLSGAPSWNIADQIDSMVVRGTLDGVNPQSSWQKKRKLFPEEAIYYAIEGGNFSNYVNTQLFREDFIGTITTQEQQDSTIEYIEDFLMGLSLRQ